jgi:hypothetical protein
MKIILFLLITFCLCIPCIYCAKKEAPVKYDTVRDDVFDGTMKSVDVVVDPKINDKDLLALGYWFREKYESDYDSVAANIYDDRNAAIEGHNVQSAQDYKKPWYKHLRGMVLKHKKQNYDAVSIHKNGMIFQYDGKDQNKEMVVRVDVSH